MGKTREEKIVYVFIGMHHTLPRGEGGFKFDHTWANLKTGEERRQNRYWNMPIHLL